MGSAETGSGSTRSMWPSPMYHDLVEELLRLSRRKVNEYPDAILGASEFAILWALHESGPLTLRELADYLDLEQSTINRQANAAIKHGHLERFSVPGSLSRKVRPTTSGTRAFEHDGAIRARRLAQVFADLAPGTPAALLHELRAFNDAYERTVSNQYDPSADHAH